jgi:hypothetical protein
VKLYPVEPADPAKFHVPWSHLADLDSLLAQRRFGADPMARGLREQIAAFTAAAAPAASGGEDR